MKKYFSLIAVCVSIVCAQAQQSLTQVLTQIEANNLELASMQYQTKAQQLALAAGNNLEDPTVEYSYLFNSPANAGNETELIVSQGFDFPTAYAARSKYNKLKERVFTQAENELAQSIKLQAVTLCIQMIGLNQQKALLDTHYKNLSALCLQAEEQLQKGNANALEVNKVKMELMELQTECSTNDAAFRKALQSLIALNGGKPITFDERQYPALPAILSNPLDLADDFKNNDASFIRIKEEELVSRQGVKVAQAEGLPKLQVGFRRNTAMGEDLNGFVVGTSLPLFANKGKVKAAKAQQLCNELQLKSVQTQTELYLQALCNQKQQLESAVKAYDSALLENQLVLLKRGLELGKYSLVEYLTEVNQVIGVQKVFVALENDYQLVCYELIRYRL